MAQGTDFTIILHAGFMCTDPKSAKNMVKPSVFSELLGSAIVKAARNFFVKATPAHGTPTGNHYAQQITSMIEMKLVN